MKSIVIEHRNFAVQNHETSHCILWFFLPTHGQTLADRDKPRAEFSTLEVAACHAMHLLHSIAIWPNLELKTRPKQLLGSLPLDITLPDPLIVCDLQGHLD
jgi:hypothetical protein